MKEFMYGCIAAMCFVFTICACVLTHYHTKKAKVTNNMGDVITVTYYVDKDDKEAIRDAASNVYWAVDHIDY